MLKAVWFVIFSILAQPVVAIQDKGRLSDKEDPVVSAYHFGYYADGNGRCFAMVKKFTKYNQRGWAEVEAGMPQTFCTPGDSAELWRCGVFEETGEFSAWYWQQSTADRGLPELLLIVPISSSTDRCSQ